ncbi:MAG: tRNA (guanosine(46)-N7)-methyltransferase TrmB [Rhabdochlamydiaceae bacterium]|nr:tRNA (guanosine(46)-N7)-methyltransferase TrmB [Rhabdochlamydiaceae bacterium]
MKPKNLKFPFDWESRAPLLQDDVFYVPNHYEQHDLWSKEKLLGEHFSRFASISVEYCAGNGAWIAEKAKENLDVLWIAVDKRFDRVRKIWAKKQNLALDNLFIVCGDAFTFTKNYLPSGVVNEIFINFPDPWPKARHAKHRVVQNYFVQEMARVSKEGGEAVWVTDDAPYSLQILSEMLEGKIWEPSFNHPFYTTTWPTYGTSFFEALWKEQGKEIRYMKFIKNTSK